MLLQKRVFFNLCYFIIYLFICANTCISDEKRKGQKSNSEANVTEKSNISVGTVLHRIKTHLFALSEPQKTQALFADYSLLAWSVQGITGRTID
jgi:hypothetical protein